MTMLSQASPRAPRVIMWLEIGIEWWSHGYLGAEQSGSPRVRNIFRGRDPLITILRVIIISKMGVHKIMLLSINSSLRIRCTTRLGASCFKFRIRNLSTLLFRRQINNLNTCKISKIIKIINPKMFPLKLVPENPQLNRGGTNCAYNSSVSFTKFIQFSFIHGNYHNNCKE